MKTVIMVMALVVLMVIVIGCATASGVKRPKHPNIPMALPDHCDLHYDWQCSNTDKWLKCSMNEQCIKDNDIAI